MKVMAKRLGILLADISLTALLLLGVYVGNYKVPQKGIKAATLSAMDEQNTEIKQAAENTVTAQPPQMTENGLMTTAVKKDAADWHTKFAEHFTDSVVATDSSYQSSVYRCGHLCGRYHLLADCICTGYIRKRL